MAAQRDSKGRFIKGSGGVNTEIRWRDNEAMQEVVRIANLRLRNYADSILKEAVQRAPKKSGDMAHSGKVREKSLAGGAKLGGSDRVNKFIIIFDSPAAYVELGTQGMHRQPFMWPAMEAKRSEFLAKIENAI